MSKLITINGYSIKLSKKEVANKLEMLFTTCSTINIDNLDDKISFALRCADDLCGCLCIKKAFNIKYVITNGEYFFKCIALKSNATLFDCVNELMIICDKLIKYGKVEYANKLLPNYRPDWFNKGQEVENTEPAEPAENTENAEPVDYTKMSDNELHDIVLSQLDYINRDLMETCVYNELNGNGKYVHVSDNDFMDVTTALAEYNRRFGTTEIFCLIYRHFESRKTHVEYDSFDDTMYIVEVIPRDDDGNILEYGYYVGDYYVRYGGVTENIEIIEVNETENTNDTKNEKEVKKALKKTNREFKVNNTTYSVVNNTNYNKEFAFEPNSMKYYAMKLLSTDGVTKSWVKTGITGNTIERVKEKITEWEDFNQYVENYDNTKPAEVTNKINVEPAEPDTPVNVDVNTSYPAKENLNVDINSNYPVKDTNNLTLSDTAKTHIRNAYNWVIGELINGLCDNKPVTSEYKECFNMLHGGEKLVNHIYNECMENGFDVGWCGLGQAPAEIKKYDSWLIKNHIRNMLVLDGVFSLPADNTTIENEILNIPAKKMNSILDLIEQCNSTMEKTMLLDYVSFETGLSYDAIKQIYDDYIKETFLDDDETTFHNFF